MAAEALVTPCPCRKPASLPPPPALFVARARSRVADQGPFSGPPDTPPRRSPVTVPFLWEDAPGKPKPTPTGAGPVPEDGEGSDRQDSGHADRARPLPLKLPPRLQHATSFAASDTSLSPKTVLQGPYYGCVGSGRRRPRCGPAAFRRTPSAGVGLFSRTWSKPWAVGGTKSRGFGGGGDHERDAAGPDAPWCSPASSSSSSSVSTCFGADDHGHGHGGRAKLVPVDGREACSEEDDGSPRARASVRITRFRRNQSLPSLTTSNLWASLRRSVKQITPWS